MATADKSESMMKQAQHIWSMLDDMAAQDPTAYRKFIDKQLKEGRDAVKPPDSHMCVQTQILNSTSNERVFINIMDWPRIPAPKTDEDPIPTMGGTIFKTTDENGKQCSVVPVAFNTQVLKDYGLESTLLEERRLLINLAIDYVEDQCKVKLSRSFVILPKSVRCKGPVEKSQSNLMNKLSGRDKNFESELGELEKTFGPLAAGCKDSLLQQLSSLASSDGDDVGFSTSFPSTGDPVEIRLPGDHTVKHSTTGGAKLIEEIVSTETPLCKPEYELNVVDADGEDTKQRLVVRIKLPGVTSVRECSLEISDDDLYLLIPDRYELALTFPSRTQSAESQSAKFSKRTSTLTVTVPVAD